MFSATAREEVFTDRGWRVEHTKPSVWFTSFALLSHLTSLQVQFRCQSTFNTCESESELTLRGFL